MEAVIVPENGTMKTFPLTDTTFITIFGEYKNPSIAELKSQSNQQIKYAGNKEKCNEKMNTQTSKLNIVYLLVTFQCLFIASGLSVSTAVVTTNAFSSTATTFSHLRSASQVLQDKYPNPNNRMPVPSRAACYPYPNLLSSNLGAISLDFMSQENFDECVEEVMRNLSQPQASGLLSSLQLPLDDRDHTEIPAKYKRRAKGFRKK